VQLFEYAQNYKTCEYVPKFRNMIVSSVQDFAWSG